MANRTRSRYLQTEPSYADIYAGARWTELAEFHDRYYDPITLVLMTFGLIGNFSGLITLFRSKSLQTHHFLFYKALTFAELMCNVQFILSKVVDVTYRIERDGTTELWYKTMQAAYFQAVIQRLVYSSAGYLILYTTLYISFDRLIALWLPALYQQFSFERKMRLASYFLATAIFLSVVVNSWAALLETMVTPVTRFNITTFVLSRRPLFNNTLYAKASEVKDYYNVIIRLAYFALLVLLTVGVIAGFIKLEKRRRAMVPAVNAAVGTNRLTTRQKRIEGSLFGLMVAVAVLAMFQITPREAHRLVTRLYPEKEVVQQAMSYTFPESERLVYMRIYFFGHCWLLTIANLTTAIDRSVKFYLYVCLNKQIRREFITVWCKYDCQSRRKTGYGTIAKSVSHMNNLNVCNPPNHLSSFRSITLNNGLLKQPLIRSNSSATPTIARACTLRTNASLRLPNKSFLLAPEPILTENVYEQNI